MNKLKTLVFVGSPGSGKGTYATLLDKKYPNKFYHFCSGDMFRALNADENEPNEITREVKETISKGQLVSDELTIELFTKHIFNKIEEKKYNPGKQILLLDGIPRTEKQVELLEDKELLDIQAIVEFTLPEETILERVKLRGSKENRVDDQDEEIVKARLKTFKKTTLPAIKLLAIKSQEAQKLKIQNIKPIEEVFKELDFNLQDLEII